MKRLLTLTLATIMLFTMAACYHVDHVLKYDADYHWLEDKETGEKSEIEAHYGGSPTYTKKAICYICGTEYGEVKPHEHMEEGTWQTNSSNTQHRLVCVCGEVGEAENHKGGEATHEKRAVCEICGFEYGELLPEPDPEPIDPDPVDPVDPDPIDPVEPDPQPQHTHKGGNATCVDRAVCTECGEAYGEVNPKKHTGETEVRDAVEATYDKKGYTGDTYCVACGEMLEKGTSISKVHTHTYNTKVWKGDENAHWHECSCGDKANLASHKGGVATSEEKAICSVCGLPYGELDPTNIVRKEGSKLSVYSEYRDEAEDKAYALLASPVINGDLLKAKINPLKLEYESAPKAANSQKVPKNKLYIDSEQAKQQGVYIGYNDWYFYEDSIEDYEGTNLFTSKQLEEQLKKYQRQYDYCVQNGIKYYLSFAPNKNTIYPEYMHEDYVKADYTRLDQLIDYIRANSDIPVIDFREDILTEKAANPGVDLYHRLDTHWNQHAALIATNALLREVQKDFPATKLLNKDDFAIAYLETYMKDQAWYLGYYDEFVQEAPQYVPLNGWNAKLKSIDDTRIGEFGLSYIWADGFHEGNHACEFSNKNNADAPSAVIFRDSFGAPMLKFLGESFSESAIYWEDFDISLIMDHSPDVVIVEVAERFLTN